MGRSIHDWERAAGILGLSREVAYTIVRAADVVPLAYYDHRHAVVRRALIAALIEGKEI
jgi:hypothetical protein